MVVAYEKRDGVVYAFGVIDVEQETLLIDRRIEEMKQAITELEAQKQRLDSAKNS